MRLRAVLSAALAGFTALAFAQEAPKPATPLDLKLKLASGQIHAYKIQVDQKGTVSLPGSGQNMPLDTALTAYAKLFVGNQNSDGTWAASYKIGGMKILMNGAPMNNPAVSKGIEIKGTLSENGGFTPSTDSLKGIGGMSMSMSPGQTMNSVIGNMMLLPTKAVNVGDTWSTTVPLPFDPTGKSNLNVDSKILGVDTLNGDQIVRIQHDTSGPLNMTLTEPMPLTITGTIKGTGTSRISMNTGTPLDDTSVQHLVVTVNGTNPSGNGEQFNVSLNMDISSHIESYVSTAPAVTKGAKAKAKGNGKK